MAHIRRVFETNTFGVMAMCQAVIPQMRARRAGTIVNVTSSVTLASFPLAAPYKASKQAIEGFSEALAEELAFFGIRGLGSIYYLAYASNHSQIVEDRDLWALGGFVVLVSIFVHGFSATPVMRRIGPEPADGDAGGGGGVTNELGAEGVPAGRAGAD